jgi:nitrate reductase gamma subunit
VAIGVFSSVIYPHPPFVAVGAISGATLKPKRAVLVALSICLVNQVYGYTVRQYPWSADSLLWGLMLGLGTLTVTALALLRPPFSQKTLRGHCLWLGARCFADTARVALMGFAVFQSLILSVDWLLTGSHTLTWAIVRSILVNTTGWAIALTLIHLVFVRFITRSNQLIA